jgi:hypothetical protein
MAFLSGQHFAVVPSHTILNRPTHKNVVVDPVLTYCQIDFCNISVTWEAKVQCVVDHKWRRRVFVSHQHVTSNMPSCASLNDSIIPIYVEVTIAAGNGS